MSILSLMFSKSYFAVLTWLKTGKLKSNEDKLSFCYGVMVVGWAILMILHFVKKNIPFNYYIIYDILNYMSVLDFLIEITIMCFFVYYAWYTNKDLNEKIKDLKEKRKDL